MIRSIQQASPAPPQPTLTPRLRSLTLKLTLAFLCMGLLGALLVAVFVSLRTQSAFNQFVADRGPSPLVSDLAKYYAANGRWQGVEGVFERERARQPATTGHEPPQPVLVAVDGQVVVGDDRYPAGSRLTPAERSRAQPIVVDSSVVGWLIGGFGGRRPGPGTPEADFLQQLSHAITYSAIGATTIALLLGVLLARTLTQPLRELTMATQAVAQGALGRQVTVRSRDELGVLASSFNRMSADLARASALRRQMTADIAHDLRTPLSVILGYTEALRDAKLEPAQDIFDTLHTEAQHLQHLIDDLRTLSLADAGELSLTRMPLQPELLLERAAAAYKAQAQTHGIELRLEQAANLPQVEVDPERMAQVLGNLLSNALRYTPVGGAITLAAEAHADTLRLRISDTGAGIAPEAVPHIFERFYRADSAREQEHGSSGLGLAIARSLVEAHGGSILVESTLGQGTTFTIALPVRGAVPAVRVQVG